MSSAAAAAVAEVAASTAAAACSTSSGRSGHGRGTDTRCGRTTTERAVSTVVGGPSGWNPPSTPKASLDGLFVSSCCRSFFFAAAAEPSSASPAASRGTLRDLRWR